MTEAVAHPRPSAHAAFDHLRITMAVLALMPTLWLGWLVYHGRPLPFPMRSAAFVTIVFARLQ